MFFAYRGEFYKCVKELYDERHCLVVHVAVQDVEEASRLRHQVNRLDVVRLFTQIVLKWIK
jgi:hypothetical protein